MNIEILWGAGSSMSQMKMTCQPRCKQTGQVADTKDVCYSRSQLGHSKNIKLELKVETVILRSLGLRDLRLSRLGGDFNEFFLPLELAYLLCARNEVV